MLVLCVRPHLISIGCICDEKNLKITLHCFIHPVIQPIYNSMPAYPYSLLKLFTGLANAALTDLMLMVSNAIINVTIAANTNIHQCSEVR